MNKYKMRSHQSGVALIIVLMLLAIMITIAGLMSERLFLHIQRATNQNNHQQAYWYSVALEKLAMKLIMQSIQNENTVNLKQTWAVKDQSYQLDFGQVKASIVDQQSCFNLNALANAHPNINNAIRPYMVETFLQLLTQLKVDSYQAEVIADSTWEYLDNNDAINSVVGALEQTYQAFNPAYLPPNGMIADSSELRSVYQVNTDVFKKIQPFICALPTTDLHLNVNTITIEKAQILVAMFAPMLDLNSAKQLIDQRPQSGWQSVAEFLTSAQLINLDQEIKKKAQAFLTVTSNYFKLDGQILVGDSLLQISSLLHSMNNNMAVVHRRFGGFSGISDLSSD